MAHRRDGQNCVKFRTYTLYGECLFELNVTFHVERLCETTYLAWQMLV